MPIIFDDPSKEGKWRKLKLHKHWVTVLINIQSTNIYRACRSCPMNVKWHSENSNLYRGSGLDASRYLPAEIERKGKLYLVIGWNSDTMEWRGVEINETKFPLKQ